MYAHGDTYDGQWQADTMHGKGVMCYRDGSVYDGDWDNGQVCDIRINFSTGQVVL